MSARRGKPLNATRTTPGRRKRDEYVAFNSRPAEVGTRTGRVMPKDVPVDNDGFEDPDAFFKSDSVDASTSDPKSFSTPRMRGAVPNTSSSGQPSTLRGANRRSGRLSQLLDPDHDESLDDDLLHSDNDDPNTTPPQPFFQSSPNPPPSVPIPNRSLLPPPSPLDFDDIPSPLGKRKTAFNNANASSSRKLLPPAQFDDMDESPTRRPGKGKGKDARTHSHEDDARVSDEIETRHDDEEDRAEDQEEDQEEDNSDTQPVRRAGAERKHSGPVVDEESDPGVNDTYEDTYQNTYEGDANESVNGSVNMEEEAIRDESGEPDATSDEEDNGPTPVPAKRGRPAKKQHDGAPTPRPIKRQRASQITAVGSYCGDFKTRSGRNHFRPLKYWAGERYEYRPGPAAPVVDHVIHIPEPETPLGAPKKRGRPKRQVALPPTPMSEGEDEADPEDGIDDHVNEEAVVVVYPSEREVLRRVVLPKSKLNPKQVGNDFKYQKVFGDGKFIASGVVFIPVGKSKPAKPSRDNAYVFYVIDGTVNVILHTTSFLCGTGAQFIIPRGNNYCIENSSPTKEAKLFFAQARKIKSGEDSDIDEDDGDDEGAGNTEAETVVEEEDEEAEEDSPPPPPKKRGPGRPRKSN